MQVYVLEQDSASPPLYTPYLYFLFILWLPFSIQGLACLMIGFVTGLVLDYFTMTPGLHAAACVLIAYARPFVITVLIPKDTAEFNYREPRRGQWAGRLIRYMLLC